MDWYQVVIKNSNVGDICATSLINDFHREFVAAGLPPAARVFHTTTVMGDHIYFFSPEAWSIAGNVLLAFKATVCPSHPDLHEFTQIKL